jgi:inosine-uridine nucleoside N-ribohydrolase
VLLHVDSDFGGDTDDACALAMLLGQDDVEIAGITTSLEHEGKRAGCAQHYLDLAARPDIPVAAGVEGSSTSDEQFISTWGDPRYWPDEVAPKPSSPDLAISLLQDNIRRGATVLAIGSFTNLARLELDHPGALNDVEIVSMSGWLDPFGDGLPDWGPEYDFNIQADTGAAAIVADAAHVTFVTLAIAMRTQLRHEHLDRLRASGPIGALLARQSEAYASDMGMGDLGVQNERLADDLLNIQWDPLAAAVVTGWTGASIEDVNLDTHLDDGVLTLRRAPDGRRHRVVVDIDADQFTQLWLSDVEAADRKAATARGSDAR